MSDNATNEYDDKIYKLSESWCLDRDSSRVVKYNSSGASWNTLCLVQDLIRVSKKKRTPGKSYRPFSISSSLTDGFSEDELMAVSVIFFPFLLIFLMGIVFAAIIDLILLPIGIFNYFWEKNAEDVE